MNRMLIVIPKADKTIIGIFHEDRCIFKQELTCDKNNYQLDEEVVQRKKAILSTLNESGINLSRLDAISAVGGLLRPVEGGTYIVNDAMITDLINNYNGKHASNLGGIIAARIAEDLNITAFIIDPPVVDEMEDIARYSGYPKVERKSIFHALNQKATARRAASTLGKTYERCDLLVAHLGNGISIAAHQHGKVIDVNNGLHGDGPFSLERAGTIPSAELIDLCYDGTWSKEQLLQKITYQSGLKGYLGIEQITALRALLEKNDPLAGQITQAMGYQIVKGIGEMAAVLCGKVDAIVLTGEFAAVEPLTEFITQKVHWISDVLVYPGEADLQALNAGTLRVLRNEEKPKNYQPGKEEGLKHEERV